MFEARLSSDDGRAGRWDGVWVAAAALALYVVLGQSVEFIDSSMYLIYSQRGAPGDPRHVAFTPLLTVWSRAWAPLLSHYDASRLLSAVACAAAAITASAAARCLGMARRRRLLFTLLVVCCPAVVFCATVVGPYGPAFAVGTVGLYFTVRAARSGSSRPALLAGLATGLASTLHATGNLLPALALPLLVALRPAGWPVRAVAAQCGRVLLGHVLFVVSFVLLASALGWPTGAGTSATFLLGCARHAVARLDAVPATVWREWFVPFAPLSVLVFVALAVPALRRLAIATLCGLCPYLAATFLLLSGGTMIGVYVLPVTWPGAMVVAGFRSVAVGAAAVVVALAWAVARVEAHDVPERGVSYVEGLREATGGDPAYLIIGIAEDVEAIFVRDPAQPYFFLPDLALLAPDVVAEALPYLDALVADQRAQGRDVFFTAAARRWLVGLESYPVPTAAPILREHLAARYTLEPVRAKGFCAERLSPQAPAGPDPGVPADAAFSRDETGR